jgi:hypothetical protein
LSVYQFSGTISTTGITVPFSVPPPLTPARIRPKCGIYLRINVRISIASVKNGWISKVSALV